MEQMSLFDEQKVAFPLSHEDVLELHKRYIDDGEKDEDAFTWKEIKNGYDSANNFCNGLALVEKVGKLMYIDHGGAVIWEER